MGVQNDWNYMLLARGVWGGWYVRTRVCNVFWLSILLQGNFFMHCLWIVRYISDVSPRKLTTAVTTLIGLVSSKFVATDCRWQSRRWFATGSGVSGPVRGDSSQFFYSLLLSGSELPLVESFGLLNGPFPFPPILDAGYPVLDLLLQKTSSI
jgi:hypothetical protein